jgi:AcrR family transcriptional regulator
MTGDSSTQSARQRALLEQAYQYALQHGLTDLSLRPLARAIGSSPRVLLFLFGSKDGLIRALLSRARADELSLLRQLYQLHEAGDGAPGGLAAATERVWSWLAAEDHRALLTLWVEGYARSLTDPDGAWSGFAETTVEDWLGVLGNAQPAADRHTTAGRAQRTLALAVLRGALLDLLATGDIERTTAAVRQQLDSLCRPLHSHDDR